MTGTLARRYMDAAKEGRAATNFGTLPSGEAVEMHTLSTASGVVVTFLNLGGIITSILTPDRDGVMTDVTPGYDSLEGYLGDPRYFGALIGRYANRIANARFELDGVAHELPANDGRHQLHGGPRGFNSVLWDVAPFTRNGAMGAELTHVCPAGSGGFPGELRARVIYTLTPANELVIDYEATTDEATPVNLTQHTYFNLAGHSSGDILQHDLTMSASRYLVADHEIIPTGELASVSGTHFDFRVARPIRASGGVHSASTFTSYDHCFVVDGEMGVLRPAARLSHAPSGRTLEVETTEPGIQLYAGEHLRGGSVGKGGTDYLAHTSLALETQHFPNSPNEPRFPSTILRPGDTYRSRTIYRFLTS